MSQQMGLFPQDRPAPGTVLFFGLEAIRNVYGEGAYRDALESLRIIRESERLVEAYRVAVPVTPPLSPMGGNIRAD